MHSIRIHVHVDRCFTDRRYSPSKGPGLDATSTAPSAHDIHSTLLCAFKTFTTPYSLFTLTLYALRSFISIHHADQRIAVSALPRWSSQQLPALQLPE